MRRGGPKRQAKRCRHARCTHFLKMEINVLSFDPSFCCSSAWGASGDGWGGGVAVAEAEAEDEEAKAHMAQPSRAFLNMTHGRSTR